MENNAWGFVNIGREPEFISIYVSGNIRKVKYLARVKDIISADEANLARDPQNYDTYDPDKKVIIFEDESLKELENPIPFGTRTLYSLRYTTFR